MTEKHFTVDHLMVSIYPDTAAMAKAAAGYVADRIRSVIAAQGMARVIFATGNSQLGFLQALIHCEDMPWSQITAFHLDEYIGLPERHPASFRRYLRERLFDHLPFAAVHLLDGEAADPTAECQRYTALLQAAPIDVACVGIGENGHLAFNDPPADFDTPAWVHVVTLDEACRRQQVGEGHFPTMEAVPTQALTLTIPAIMQANAIASIVPEQRKAAIVKQTLLATVSPACPASILRQHPDCHLFLEAESSAALG